jgi:hypothetical protein
MDQLEFDHWTDRSEEKRREARRGEARLEPAGQALLVTVRLGCCSVTRWRNGRKDEVGIDVYAQPSHCTTLFIQISHLPLSLLCKVRAAMAPSFIIIYCSSLVRAQRTTAPSLSLSSSRSSIAAQRAMHLPPRYLKITGNTATRSAREPSDVRTAGCAYSTWR